MADNHTKEQDIIDKAKEINKKIKEKQANSQSNISSEIGNEEPLPLNDPFVGDSSLTGGSTLMMSDPEEAKNEMSLYKFKLVGVMSSDKDDGFASLINASAMFFEPADQFLSTQLISLKNARAVFCPSLTELVRPRSRAF